MMAIANEPDLFNIVDVLLSSFSGAAAGAASAAPWRVPPRFLLPAEADGQAKKRAPEHAARGGGSRRRKSLWILGSGGFVPPEQGVEQAVEPGPRRDQRYAVGLEIALQRDRR